MIKAFYLVVLAVAFISSSSAIAHAQSAGLRISPTTTQKSMRQGTSAAVTIFVENTSAESKTVNVDFRDTTIDASGKRVVAPKGQVSSSDGVSAYLSGPSSLVLSANQRQVYTATLTVPSNAEQNTRYGALAFTAADSTQSVVSLVTATITAAPGTPPTAPTPPATTTTTSDNSASSPRSATGTSDKNPSTSSQTKDISQEQNSSKTLPVERTGSVTEQNFLWPVLILLIVLFLGGTYLWRRKRGRAAPTEETAMLPQVPPVSAPTTNMPADSSPFEKP